MKKNLVILAVLICVKLYAQHSYQSPYRFGLKLGYSLYTLTGDLTKSEPGGSFLGGFWFQLKMNEKWTVQTELLLLDKGIGTLNGKSPHWVNLHYFEMPFLFQYHRKAIYFEFGPSLGYMLTNAEHLNGNSSPDLVFKYPFTGSELSFNLGIGCTLNEKWTLGLRLSHSVLPVRGPVPLVSNASYNRLLSLSLTRQLNKRKAGPQE